MPSQSHQTFALLFRSHPHLAFELARRAGMPIRCPVGPIEVVATDFDDPLQPGNPVVADLAFVTESAGMLDGDGTFRCGLVLEIQLDEDPNKQWTIIVYRAGLRRREHCPAWAAVFSPNERVRRQFTERLFAREPELRPHVIRPSSIELVSDLETAMADCAWAVLSMAMHPRGPDTVVRALVTIRALLRVKLEHYGSYIQLVSSCVGENVMQRVREQLPIEEIYELSEWEREGSAFAHGRAEGLEQGLEAMREVLRSVMALRGFSLDSATQARILNADLEQLRLLIPRVLQIESAAELF